MHELLFVDTLWPDFDAAALASAVATFGQRQRPLWWPVSDDAPAPAKRMSELTLRILTGFAMIAVAMLALVLGGFVFWLLAVVAGMFMMAEWADLHGIDAKQKRLAQYSLFVPLALMAPPPGAGPYFLTLGLADRRHVLHRDRHRQAHSRARYAVCRPADPVVAADPPSERRGGLHAWALALVWATDNGAYAAGRVIGGPKLWPAVSPKKTWRGWPAGSSSHRCSPRSCTRRTACRSA